MQQSADVRWVTHAGKHIPLTINETKDKKSTAKGKTTTVSSSGSGEKGKKQLSKHDKLNNLKK